MTAEIRVRKCHAPGSFHGYMITLGTVDVCVCVWGAGVLIPIAYFSPLPC